MTTHIVPTVSIDATVVKAREGALADAEKQADESGQVQKPCHVKIVPMLLAGAGGLAIVLASPLASLAEVHVATVRTCKEGTLHVR